MIFLFTYPKKPKFFSWLIKFRLRTKYSHVAISSNLTNSVYQASHGIVHKLDMVDFLRSNNVIFAKEMPMSSEEINRGLLFLEKQIGKLYSVFGALASTYKILRIFGIGKNGDKRFICSELAHRALEESLQKDLSHAKINDDYVDPKLFEQILDDLTNHATYIKENKWRA